MKTVIIELTRIHNPTGARWLMKFEFPTYESAMKHIARWNCTDKWTYKPTNWFEKRNYNFGYHDFVCLSSNDL
jgi:hypothetical protein